MLAGSWFCETTSWGEYSMEMDDLRQILKMKSNEPTKMEGCWWFFRIFAGVCQHSAVRSPAFAYLVGRVGISVFDCQTSYHLPKDSQPELLIIMRRLFPNKTSPNHFTYNLAPFYSPWTAYQRLIHHSWAMVTKPLMPMINHKVTMNYLYCVVVRFFPMMNNNYIVSRKLRIELPVKLKLLTHHWIGHSLD